RKPAGKKVVNEHSDYPGVEFKSERRQVVAAGSIHPETGELYQIDPIEDDLGSAPEAPEELLKLIGRGSAAPNRSSAPTDLGSIDIEPLLGALDPTDYRDYDKWLRLMFSCHEATLGEGIGAFVEWSTSDAEYAGHDERIRAHWDSCRTDHANKVTRLTLFKAVTEAGRPELVAAATRTDPSEDFSPSPDFGTESPGINGVLGDWVWVAGPSRFIRRSDQQRLSDKQWKSLYAHLYSEGDVLTAVWKGKLRVPKFELLDYSPGEPEFPDGLNGGRYNIWRPSPVKPIAGDTGWFEKHVAYLFPDNKERGYVLDYLALLVREPAPKMHFTLLVQGHQGTGKSALGEIIRLIVGAENVVKPSNEEIQSRFGSWQVGKSLAIIEELMTIGRRELSNRLKTVITEPHLRIEEKYGTPFSIPNHLNLLGFTNHMNALPIENGDRRWLVVSSPADPRPAAYYDELFAHISSDEGPAAVKHMLLERHVGLDPKGRAPATDAKEAMRRHSMGDVEENLLSLFEIEAPPFHFDLVRVEDVEHIAADPRGPKPKNLRSRVLRFMQSELHAEKHSRYTKNDGRLPAYHLWSVRNHDHWRRVGPTARGLAY
ncbi:MAG: PriCT-2 domain-containing protein, partial [Thalassospira sp.]|nr:PriCT-2 domain-containing protein [Thalassospira sp.]